MAQERPDWNGIGPVPAEIAEGIPTFDEAEQRGGFLTAYLRFFDWNSDAEWYVLALEPNRRDAWCCHVPGRGHQHDREEWVRLDELTLDGFPGMGWVAWDPRFRRSPFDRKRADRGKHPVKGGQRRQRAVPGRRSWAARVPSIVWGVMAILVLLNLLLLLAWPVG